jgi:hypothetical protein
MAAFVEGNDLISEIRKIKVKVEQSRHNRCFWK